MRIGCAHDRRLDQAIVIIHSLERLDYKHGKTEVVDRRLAWGMKKNACICRERPVFVLAGTVNAFERLLVQEATKAVLAGYALHDGHHEHIMVDGKIGFLEYGRKLKLVWRDLIVTRLARYAKLEGIDLNVLHELFHTSRNRTKIMVIHLLVLGRIVSHECPSCHHKVWTSGIERFINKEVFLFPTKVGHYPFHVWEEILCYSCGGLVNGVQRFFQRHLIVESLTSI